MAVESDSTLEQLVSRAAITELLHSYARHVDDRDFDQVGRLFTEDCLAEYGLREGDTLHSAQEVVSWIRTQLHAVAATSHHISNVEIDFIDRDHATTTCYVYAWHELDGAPRAPTVLGRYIDRVERTGGRWRIAHRQMFAHGAESFPAGIMRPLPLGR
jgi:3-phenylpropionate/cinnamic acid dioxygenase small subunit